MPMTSARRRSAHATRTSIKPGMLPSYATEMRVLLLRPVPANERFGLGPFFRIEPLGMEYIAAALEARGHDVTLADLRFTSLEMHLQRARPGLVGIAAMHALETDDVLALVRRVRAWSAEVTIVIGGHSAAAYPMPFLVPDVAAVVTDDGEVVLPRVADALDRGAALNDIGGMCLQGSDGEPVRSAGESGTFVLDDVPLPARHYIDEWRKEYACLAHRPVWLIETARGCPFRCSFCSIWQLHARAVRERSIESVCRDFATVGDEVFVADDLFWHHPSRSLDLASELRRRGIKKRWLLVQSRVDLVARHPELLEAWRPIAKDFDIFFGLEAATDQGLKNLTKDATVDETARGVDVARRLGYGVTGNFVIDPAWERAGLRAVVGLRRAARVVPGRLHHPHAASRHRLLRDDAVDAQAAQMVRLRYASSLMAARARRGAVL